MERFIVTKESRKLISELDRLFNMKDDVPKAKSPTSAPSEMILESALPYFRKWRTMH